MITDEKVINKIQVKNPVPHDLKHELEGTKKTKWKLYEVQQIPLILIGKKITFKDCSKKIDSSEKSERLMKKMRKSSFLKVPGFLEGKMFRCCECLSASIYNLL